MTAVSWTLTGLMAGSLTVLAAALFYALTRIDAQLVALGARIDAQGARLDSRIDVQGAELRGDIRELRETVTALDLRLSRAGG